MRIGFITSTVLALALAAPASATTLLFNDFSNTTGLQINGDAVQATLGTRKVLRVTPSKPFQGGSVFATSAIAFGADYGFSTRFTFNFNKQAFGGADGLVFVIQPKSAGVGTSGGGLGYKGIGNSLGVEFDSYNNGVNDLNSGNHVAVDLNGSLLSKVQAESPFILDSAKDLTAWIDYNGTTKKLEVRISDKNIRPLAALLSYTFDLASTIGKPNAFVGFTAGTGGSYSNQDLVNWEFRDKFTPIGVAVPEPASWAMMLTGFGIVGGTMRYRRKRLSVSFG